MYTDTITETKISNILVTILIAPLAYCANCSKLKYFSISIFFICSAYLYIISFFKNESSGKLFNTVIVSL